MLETELIENLSSEGEGERTTNPISTQSMASTTTAVASNGIYLNDDLLIKFKNNEKNLTVVPIDREAPTYDKYVRFF